MQLSRDEYNSIKRNAKLHVSGLPVDPKQIGGIPARSGNTAGKATDIRVVFIKPDGTLITSSREITVYNPFALPVGASVYITCKFVNNGYWIVDAEDCG